MLDQRGIGSFVDLPGARAGSHSQLCGCTGVDLRCRSGSESAASEWHHRFDGFDSSTGKSDGGHWAQVEGVIVGHAPSCREAWEAFAQRQLYVGISGPVGSVPVEPGKVLVDQPDLDDSSLQWAGAYHMVDALQFGKNT